MRLRSILFSPRSRLFLMGSLVALVLYFVTPSALRWIPRDTAWTYLGLGVLTALDGLARSRRRVRPVPDSDS